jgi:hypothetical protein
MLRSVGEEGTFVGAFPPRCLFFFGGSFLARFKNSVAARTACRRSFLVTTFLP